MSNWCWASVFELVSALLEDPPRSQCQLATAVDLSGRNCCPCPQMNSPTCNDACDNTHVLENVLGPHSGGTAGQVEFSTISNEILANQRPVACRIRLSNGAGYHYIVIIGVSTDQQQLVRVADPLLQDGNSHDYPYAAFSGGYIDGTWNQTIYIR